MGSGLWLGLSLLGHFSGISPAAWSGVRGEPKVARRTCAMTNFKPRDSVGVWRRCGCRREVREKVGWLKEWVGGRGKKECGEVG